jgi:hypothetical protein
MARERTSSARGDTLAGEAWDAGCRDVQAAINWAAGRGAVAGPPYLAAFRRLLAASSAAPPSDTPPAGPGEDRAKRADRGGAVHTGPAAAPTGRTGKGSARPKPNANGQPVAGPTPAPTPARGSGPAAEPKPGTPAEFVEDMRTLRHLLAKYGKKGLTDLIGMLAG